MPKKKASSPTMLRVRVKQGFLAEMDAYLAKVNAGVEYNKMDRSRLAREAVSAMIRSDKKFLPENSGKS